MIIIQFFSEKAVTICDEYIILLRYTHLKFIIEISGVFR